MEKVIVIRTGDDIVKIKDLCSSIITSATSPCFDVPKVPMVNRFGMRSSIFVMDEVPDNYVVERVGVLDFWNEIEGFFLANSHIPTYDLRKEYWELPEDIKFSNIDKIRIGEYICTSVGDRFIDKDYNVYKLVGFVKSSGGADVYFDIR
jgi:hypothetical protein